MPRLNPKPYDPGLAEPDIHVGFGGYELMKWLQAAESSPVVRHRYIFSGGPRIPLRKGICMPAYGESGLRAKMKAVGFKGHGLLTSQALDLHI